jgi:hypothetical protein
VTAITLKMHRFTEANRKSPAVYCGVDTHICTFRLENGTTWTFSRREAAQLDPVWAYKKVPDRRLISQRHEEMELLRKVQREAMRGSPLA